MGNKTNRPPEGTLRPKKVSEMRPRIFERAQDRRALSKAVDMVLDEFPPSDGPVSRKKKAV